MMNCKTLFKLFAMFLKLCSIQQAPLNQLLQGIIIRALQTKRFSNLSGIYLFTSVFFIPFQII